MAIFIGDTHGNFHNLVWNIKSRYKTNYIHVGDFGTTFEITALNETRYRVMFIKINDVLVQSKSYLYVCRGNHDNPLFWKESKKWSKSNLIFCEDYSIHEIEGRNVLFVGGATSVDRKVLIPGKTWFEDEKFTYDSEKISHILESVNRLDVVVTHSAPNFCYPMGINKFVTDYAKYDPTLIEDVVEERSGLTKLYQVLNTKFQISLWAYGHFHSGNVMHYNETRFEMFAKNEYSSEFQL